jgi:hypothetical protein
LIVLFSIFISFLKNPRNEEELGINYFTETRKDEVEFIQHRNHREGQMFYSNSSNNCFQEASFDPVVEPVEERVISKKI